MSAETIIEQETVLRLNKPWVNFAEDEKALTWLQDSVLNNYLLKCRWFAGKARKISFIKVQTLLNIPVDDAVAYLIILHVAYTYGDEEKYAMPVSFVPDDYQLINQINPKAFITKMSSHALYCAEEEGVDNQPIAGVVGESKRSAEEPQANQQGFLIDAIYDFRFQSELFNNIFNSTSTPQKNGAIVYHKGRGLSVNDEDMAHSCRIPELEQSNSSLIYGDKYFFKLYRKLFREVNPEVEMLQFLTETGGFKNIPAFCGSMMLERPGIPPVTLGLMMQKVASKSDSWVATGDDLNDFLFGFVDKAFTIRDSVFDRVELLGKRTAEMHLALLKGKGDKFFEPEQFNPDYVQQLNKSLNALLKKRLDLLNDNYSGLNANAKKLADEFIASEAIIKNFFDKILKSDLQSSRIRIHGDYHLGQVLFTGADFLIIDFEGEPESSITDRKIKHSPLKDVAGMIRSFHYAVCAKLYFSKETQNIAPERLQKAADRWYKLITDAYVDAYMQAIGNISGIFSNRSEFNFLLQLHLLEKAVYELGYELNGRPDWLRIPLKGIRHVLSEIEKFN